MAVCDASDQTNRPRKKRDKTAHASKLILLDGGISEALIQQHAGRSCCHTHTHSCNVNKRKHLQPRQRQLLRGSRLGSKSWSLCCFLCDTLKLYISNRCERLEKHPLCVLYLLTLGQEHCYICPYTMRLH